MARAEVGSAIRKMAEEVGEVTISTTEEEGMVSRQAAGYEIVKYHISETSTRGLIIEKKR